MGYVDEDGDIYLFMANITTYWTTNHPTIWEYVEAVTDGHVVRYIPENLYIMITMDRFTSGSSIYHAMGIKIAIGEGYSDSALTGQITEDALRFFSSVNTTTYEYMDTLVERQAIADAANFNYKYWIDANGVTLVYSPISNSSGLRTIAGFWSLVCTDMTNAIYDDGEAGIFSCHRESFDINSASRYDCRPFSYVVTGSSNEYYSTMTLMDNFYGAFKSAANNKIYFSFSYFNSQRTSTTVPYDLLQYPILRSRRHFIVSKTGGLVIGDIISWIDPDDLTVRKYIVCDALDLSAGSVDYYYAIPYENACEF